ncbi:MAG TPA: hypothetical protein ENG54_03150 [Thermofilum sp.]|nr:hypothetical protein [Thermofilum sp.]
MPIVKCPYCGADVEYTSGEVVLTCPYCGTSFAISGEEIERHLMGRVNFSINEIYSIFKSWALRKPETPNDLPLKARIKNYQLNFYPYWVYRVNVTFAYEGYARNILVKGRENETFVISIPANKKMYGTPLQNYEFSLKGKVFFSSHYARKMGGTILNADISEKDAWANAWRTILNRAKAKIRMRGVTGLTLEIQNYNIEDKSFVHIPIYQVTYAYNGGEYPFLADASDARIMYAEIPVGTGFRMLALGGAVASLVAGIIISIIGIQADLPVFAITSFIGFLAIAAYSAYKGLLRKVVSKKFYV